ncbi:MAG: transcription initiation factor IIB, partial [Candidatus Bathyarchaeia archaeon]
AEKAGVSGEVQGLAIKILREAKVNRAVAGKDTTGLAAAAVYLASELKKEKITQKKIAEAAEVTEVTIRKRKGELVKKVNLAEL